MMFVFKNYHNLIKIILTWKFIYYFQNFCMKKIDNFILHVNIKKKKNKLKTNLDNISLLKNYHNLVLKK